MEFCFLYFLNYFERSGNFQTNIEVRLQEYTEVDIVKLHSLAKIRERIVYTAYHAMGDKHVQFEILILLMVSPNNRCQVITKYIVSKSQERLQSQIVYFYQTLLTSWSVVTICFSRKAILLLMSTLLYITQRSHDFIVILKPQTIFCKSVNFIVRNFCVCLTFLEIKH